MNSVVQSPVASKPNEPNELNEAEGLKRSGSSWDAFIELQFQNRAAGCRLVRNRHQGPLYVQKPFYPEGSDLAHAYLLHPPGGLVSGDKLRISIDLHEGSKALITTPGAGRVYRARADRRLQQQDNFLKLSPQSSLEWFPQETIVFPGANTHLNTHVDLSPESKFLGWEITSLGLPSCGIAFDEGELSQRLLITCEKRPLLTESLIINDACRNILSSTVGMQGNPVNGIFIAGPVSGEQGNDCESILEKIRALPVSDSNLYLNGISLVGGFIVARYLGGCTEQAKQYFTAIWQILRPFIIDRNICKPRIWAT